MKLTFTSDNGYPDRGAFGLIVLSTDLTLEQEVTPMLTAAGHSAYHARIPFEPNVTPETLARMADDIPRTAQLLSPDIPYRAIGYGCTSAATVIGSDRVEQLVQTYQAGVPVTEPISALIAACHHLGARKVGFLTPYRADVSAAMQDRLAQAGLDVTSFASFEEEEDNKVAKITETSVLDGMMRVGSGDCDIVISACTNLRSFGVINTAEARLGKPVISSNSALLWHLLRLGGSDFAGGPGRLFSA